MKPKTKNYSGLVLAVVLVSGCATQSIDENEAADGCAKLNSLIAIHQSDFDSIRTNPTHTRKLIVWQAKTHAIGRDCQIWEWGDGQSSYTCTQVYPSQNLAMAQYQKQKANLKACLGENWQETETERELAVGFRTRFSKSDFDTVVSIHSIETSGVFKDEWTVYYLVGDQEQGI